MASIADEATSPQAITSGQGHRDTRGALIITGEKLPMDSAKNYENCGKMNFRKKGPGRIQAKLERSVDIQCSFPGTFNYFCQSHNPPDLACCHIIFLSVFL